MPVQSQHFCADGWPPRRGRHYQRLLGRPAQTGTAYEPIHLRTGQDRQHRGGESVRREGDPVREVHRGADRTGQTGHGCFRGGGAQKSTSGMREGMEENKVKVCLFFMKLNITYMSQRLSKLGEYLEEGNYEMAITAYAEHPEDLSESQALELGRAYIVNQDYKKAASLVQKHCHGSTPSIYYEARLIEIKARHLLGEDCLSLITELISRVRQVPNFQDHHHEYLKEVNSTLINYTAITLAIKNQPKQVVKTHYKQFFDLLEKEQIENPLTDGIPMFLVSTIWFERWKKYAKDQTDECPGAITHFQILDHRYSSVWDPLPHKRYTNYVTYPNARVKALPKQCWLKLKSMYSGFDFKRFNMWVLGKPKEIMTELYLRRIKVKRNHDSEEMTLFISKKETWSGVAKKLQGAWGKGFLYKESKQALEQVNANEVLEEVDTSRSVFVYCSEEKEVKQRTQLAPQTCVACKKTNNLKFCQCKSVKYCSLDCLKDDRDKHRKKCELEMGHLKQQAAIADNFELGEKSFGGKRGLVGLRNLGNTCYMNSGLQCMSNTREITEYFMNNKFMTEINHSNPLGTKGNLSCAYAELMRSMWSGSDDAVSPFTFKKVIGRFAAQFSGYGQQDSQEFISYLIDGLQEDLNLVKKKLAFQTSDEVMPDQEASKQSEINYSKRTKSYIRDLMSGQFKSTVICFQCNRTSVCFDPYMLVTLQIPLVGSERDLYFIPLDPISSTKKLTITYDAQTEMEEVRKNIQARYCEESKTSIHFREVSLETMKVITDTIEDSQKFVDLIHRLEKGETNLLAYQAAVPRKGEKTMKIDYYYAGKLISYPRFLMIPIAANSSELAEMLWPSLERFSRWHSKSYSASIGIYKTMPEIKEGSLVNVNLTEELSMLKCKTDDKKIRLHSDRALNLESCLKNFTASQILQHQNQWYCSKCKAFVKASKQMQIYKSNKILVIAFKRFSRGWKVKNFIDFPIEGLDMGPFIKSNTNKQKLVYDLYGVVNHFGSMGGGHYTAYCKNFLNNRWFEFDDSRVSEVSPKQAVSQSAYVLFYRLRS